MKHFWLLLIVAAVLGTTAAWALNQSRFGARTSRFDKIVYGTDINADNVMEVVRSDDLKSGAVVEMLTPETHDFGMMAWGEKGSYTFKIKNAGSDPLELKVGESTCKCTVGSLDQSELAPGEETEVKVEWTVKSKDKKFSQRAQIITNDPTRVAIDLNINGVVSREIEFDSNEISVGDIAAGDAFTWENKVFSYYENGIEFSKANLASKQVTELADIQVEPFEPSDADGNFSTAKQAFKIKVKVKPGLRQGALSTRIFFNFHRKDENGNLVTDDDGNAASFYTEATVLGRIVGALAMVGGSQLQLMESGGYLFTFGRLKADDPMIGKAFVKLKGSEKDRTKLTIGEIKPAGVLRAKLGDPVGRGNTALYPIEIEVVPGDEPVDLTGKSNGEYGTIWVNSDNPKVPKMLIAVKFAVEAKP